MSVMQREVSEGLFQSGYENMPKPAYWSMRKISIELRHFTICMSAQEPADLQMLASPKEVDSVPLNLEGFGQGSWC